MLASAVKVVIFVKGGHDYVKKTIMKVGIIGAGSAGLTTAWLLDQECEVVLFEQQNRLGGHAHTIVVQHDNENIPIEIGFEFFNAWLFPKFNRLLNVLHVPIASFPLTYCFYTQEGVLTLSSQHAHRMLKQLFHPSRLSTLLQFMYLLQQGRRFARDADYTVTIEQFADTLFLSEKFKNNFLYPFLTAGWGCSIDAFKQFSAYDILSWITQKAVTLKPQEWYEVVGGISVYINALVAQLEKTTIRKEATIEAHMYEQSNYLIIEKNGRKTNVDHLIIATDPQQAALLLKEIVLAEKVYKQLLSFESFPVLVAVHGDQRFMPKKPDWSVANVKYDGQHSALTVYKPWHLNEASPIFRSWLPGKNPLMPEPLYALEHFNHQKVMPEYFKTQTYLKNVQGENNLWLAGCYMDNLDSHESAIASALNIAEKLMPQSNRLMHFKV